MTNEPETLAQFVARRLPVLEADVTRLRDALSAAQAELAMLTDLPLASALSSAVSDDAIRPSPIKRGISEATMQDAVVSILKEAGKAMTANELLPAVNARLGTDYPRSSLSPQLSRLKQNHVLALHTGKRWGLVDWLPHDPQYPDDFVRLVLRPNNSADASGQGTASADDREPEQQGREAGPGGGT